MGPGGWGAPAPPRGLGRVLGTPRTEAEAGLPQADATRAYAQSGVYCRYCYYFELRERFSMAAVFFTHFCLLLLTLSVSRVRSLLFAKQRLREVREPI